MFTINYSEFMSYQEDIEAINVEEARTKFEQAVENGQFEPVEAKIINYDIDVAQ